MGPNQTGNNPQRDGGYLRKNSLQYASDMCFTIFQSAARLGALAGSLSNVVSLVSHSTVPYSRHGAFAGECESLDHYHQSIVYDYLTLILSFQLLKYVLNVRSPLTYL